MKKILFLFISLFLFIPSVFAASASATISAPNQVVSGNKVKVTVKLSSSVGIGSWQMNLNYDKSMLKLSSSTGEAGGTMMANSNSTDNVKNKSYTFTFTALKTGSTSLSITGAEAYRFSDMSKFSLSTGTKTIKIITQKELEASYSKDNYLKSLGISGFEITPSFNKETLEYSATVPEDTTSINILAKANDSRSSISGAGSKEVTSGVNNFDIVVRAQNGSERTYKLTVEVKDNNPIEVSVDGKNYTVVKLKSNLPEASYKEDIVKINDFDIPAYTNEVINKKLVGLKDEEGKISLFIYEDGKYSRYVEMNFDGVLFYPKETKEVLKGYEAGKVTINNEELSCFYKNKESRYAICYGININNGEEGFYKLDKKTLSAIYFDSEEADLIASYQNKIKLYTYLIIGLSAVFVIMFMLLIVVANKKKTKTRNLKREEKVIEEKKENKKNSIEEITDEEIFVDKKKKK